jgi:DNA-directed RNA polymerase sigma subunit (sigma70/sigma32)
MTSIVAEPPLTREQAALFATHLGLVRALARRFARVCEDYRDLCQDGAVGLLTAARRYDPSRGVRFDTYAYYWVRQEILKGVALNGPFLRVGRDARFEAVRLLAAGRDAGQDGLAESVRQAARALVSRREPLGDPPSPGPPGDPHAPDVEAIWDHLSPQEAHVLRRFSDGQSLRAIGEGMGMTKQAVFHHLERARAKARQVLGQPEGRRRPRLARNVPVEPRAGERGGPTGTPRRPGYADPREGGAGPVVHRRVAAGPDA